jgi:hydroxyacylglutathione hydrolase
MLFRMIYDERLAQAAYLIGCQRAREAIVIDPERDVDRYFDLAASEGLRITAVAETHIHADFLSGARELAEKVGATVYVSDEGGPDWRSQWLHSKQAGGSYPHRLLHQGDVFSIGAIEFRVLHTPGHTPEHICFLVTDHGSGASEPIGVVTGDFVFVGDLGRPDLLETAAGFAGVSEPSARALFASLPQFTGLPDFTQVWPAHGAGSACGKALGAVPQSTVGYEKRFNPGLRAASNVDAFVRFILDGQPEPPMYFARMKRDNKMGPAILGSLPRPPVMDARSLGKIDGSRAFILDARPWSDFRAGHLPGAISALPDRTFPTVAGSFVEEKTPIYLICQPQEVEMLVRDLVRIGLDDIRGYATPATVTECAALGVKLVETPEIDVKTLQSRMGRDKFFLLDVRRASEFGAGHIPGAANAAHTRLPAALDRIPRDLPIVVNCQGGTRSARACSLLERAGRRVTNLAGGFGAWAKAGGEVVK